MYIAYRLGDYNRRFDIYEVETRLPLNESPSLERLILDVGWLAGRDGWVINSIDTNAGSASYGVTVCRKGGVHEYWYIREWGAK